VVELQQELKQSREMAVMDKKKLQDKLVEDKRKTQEANSQFNATNIGRIDFLTSFASSLPCALEDLTSEFYLYITDFHKREDDLKNNLKITKEKVRSLDVNL
jgi:hypothetical protein